MVAGAAASRVTVPAPMVKLHLTPIGTEVSDDVTVQVGGCMVRKPRRMGREESKLRRPQAWSFPPGGSGGVIRRGLHPLQVLPLGHPGEGGGGGGLSPQACPGT